MVSTTLCRYIGVSFCNSLSNVLLLGRIRFFSLSFLLPFLCFYSDIALTKHSILLHTDRGWDLYERNFTIWLLADYVNPRII